MASGRSQLRARHGGDQRTAQGLSRDARPNKPLHARTRCLSRDIAPGSSGSNAREIWVGMWTCHAPSLSREGWHARPPPGGRGRGAGGGSEGGSKRPRGSAGCAQRRRRSGFVARVPAGLWDSGAFGAPVPILAVGEPCSFRTFLHPMPTPFIGSRFQQSKVDSFME